MIDPETRAVLQATLEHLKTQMSYVRNLHESLVLLLEALKKELPEFERIHRAEFEKTTVSNPGSNRRLSALTCCLENWRIRACRS